MKWVKSSFTVHQVFSSDHCLDYMITSQRVKWIVSLWDILSQNYLRWPAPCLAKLSHNIDCPTIPNIAQQMKSNWDLHHNALLPYVMFFPHCSSTNEKFITVWDSSLLSKRTTKAVASPDSTKSGTEPSNKWKIQCVHCSSQEYMRSCHCRQYQPRHFG